jgi:hypothetical protein
MCRCKIEMVALPSYHTPGCEDFVAIIDTLL